MSKKTKTQIIQDMIKKKDMSIPEFCRQINLPYTTILSIFKSDLESASITNILKICNGLGTTFDKVRELAGEIEPEPTTNLTEEQIQIALDISNDDELKNMYYIIKNATPNDQRLYYSVLKRLDAGK